MDLTWKHHDITEEEEVKGRLKVKFKYFLMV